MNGKALIQNFHLASGFIQFYVHPSPHRQPNIVYRSGQAWMPVTA
jgi:hypothetical protein